MKSLMLCHNLIISQICNVTIPSGSPYSSLTVSVRQDIHGYLKHWQQTKPITGSTGKEAINNAVSRARPSQALCHDYETHERNHGLQSRSASYPRPRGIKASSSPGLEDYPEHLRQAQFLFFSIYQKTHLQDVLLRRNQSSPASRSIHSSASMEQTGQGQRCESTSPKKTNTIQRKKKNT